MNAKLKMVNCDLIVRVGGCSNDACDLSRKPEIIARTEHQGF